MKSGNAPVGLDALAGWSGEFVTWRGVMGYYAASRQHRGPAILILAASLCAAPQGTAVAQDMPPTVQEHVRQATVLVTAVMPGSSGGMKGTGFFLNANGLVMTNNHVVDPNHGKSPEERARSAGRVTTPDYFVYTNSGTDRAKRYPAKLIHQTEPADMALLQATTESGDLAATQHHLAFVRQDELERGKKIWLFGAPGERANVIVTQGLVDDLRTTSSGAVTYIVTDAMANPGNSGGPMVDIAGRLLGVVTHKLFQSGSADLSGAVPPQLAQQFLRAAFVEGRVPAKADLLPFVDMFTDPDGKVEFPTLKREEAGATFAMQDGSVRKGKVLDKTVRLDTALGKIEAPIKSAAYLLTRGETSYLVMDGGDVLAFDRGRSRLSCDIAGNKDSVPLADLQAVAFREPAEPTRYPASQGVALQADGCSLHLSEVGGRVSVGDASFSLEALASVSTGGGDRVVQTHDGQRVIGKLVSKGVKGRTTWHDQGLALNLTGVQRATARPLDWSFVNARGRRLHQRIRIEDSDLARIADLLESADWKQAEELLQEAGEARRTSKEARQLVRLLEAIFELRSAEFKKAAESLKKLARKDSDVGNVAVAYSEVLERYADNKYRAMSLSEPDVLWRACSASARENLSAVESQLSGLDSLDYRKKARALEDLEELIDTINQQEIGCAQHFLIDLLSKAYVIHIEEHNRQIDEYNSLVEEYNRNRSGRRPPSTSKLKIAERSIERLKDEIQRISARIKEEANGFHVDVPAADA